MPGEAIHSSFKLCVSAVWGKYRGGFLEYCLLRRKLLCVTSCSLLERCFMKCVIALSGSFRRTWQTWLKTGNLLSNAVVFAWWSGFRLRENERKRDEIVPLQTYRPDGFAAAKYSRSNALIGSFSLSRFSFP